MRQSLASSTAPRTKLPPTASSLASSNSNNVRPSAADPAKPPRIVPLQSVRILLADDLMIVLPIETCPSAPRATLASRQTHTTVVEQIRKSESCIGAQYT